MTVEKLFKKQKTPEEILYAVAEEDITAIIVITQTKDSRCSIHYSTQSLGSLSYALKVFDMEVTDIINGDS